MNFFVGIFVGMLSFGIAIAVQNFIKDHVLSALVIWLIGFVTGVLVTWVVLF